MNDLRNPYIAGAPVVETSMFFGREDVFNWIENSLTGKYVDHILVLHGQRRVGKTTVLKQIPNFLSNEYIQVFFDLQGRTNTTLDRFLWWMASEIVRSLNKQLETDLQRPKRDQFSDSDTFINEFIPGLQPKLNNHTLLLTFDEFDTLSRADIQEKLARPLINFLRRLFEIDGLNFIFSIGSSGNKLENMQAAYTDFFKTALYRKVSFLTRDDCYNLITKPVSGIIAYQPDAIQRIIEITSGHPYFTQLTCHELFSRCQTSGSRTVTFEDVNDILDDVIERGTVNLKFIWDEASDLEKWILAVLGKEEGISQKKIGQILQSQGVRFSDSDLNSAILHLRDKDVLTRDNHLVIHLMKQWLEINRPMDRVREELVQTNPIADRYIEIGDELRDRQQLEQAVESYQQALDFQDNNITALLNISEIHLDQGNISQAIAFYEKALQVDSDHIAARQGYSQAQLVRGDQARKESDIQEAIEAYQAILFVTPVHKQARQNLSEIYQEQAARYLDSGDDTQGLENLKLAMEMTPENQALKDRHQKIINDKRSALVNSWLDKADRAIKRKRWDEASTMAEEALKVNPQDLELQARVAKIKDAPRLEKIKAYRQEAENAIQKGEYNKAIAALKTATLLAPEDVELRNWLEETQTDQQNAQLRLYQNRAEQAQVAEDWDSAVAARKAALKLDPQNKVLINALAETETAHQQAKVDLLQNQLELARKDQHWNEAINAAKAMLELAPENEETKILLDQLLEAQRQARLSELLENAELAVSQERWKDAVSAWESYLEKVPGKSENYKNKLAQARLYAKLSDDYQEAQALIKRKQFNKAIPLLQGIIAKDPTYKSTSRLLVESVEAREKQVPIWRKPWLYAGVTTVLIILFGFLFSDRILAIFRGSSTRSQPGVSQTAGTTEPPENETTSATENSTALISENQAQIPDDYQNAIHNFIEETPPTFENDFSLQISQQNELPTALLDYMESNTPTIEDDFSNENPDWEIYELGNNIQPIGSFIVDEKLDPSGTWVEVTNQAVASNNFIYRFDLYLSTTIDSEFSVDVLMNEDQSKYISIGTGYSPSSNQKVRMASKVGVDQEEKVLVRGSTIENGLNDIVIINHSERISVFINGQLLGFFDTQDFEGTDILIRIGVDQAIDNFKFWDLQNAEVSDKDILEETIYEYNWVAKVETNNEGFTAPIYEFVQDEQVVITSEIEAFDLPLPDQAEFALAYTFKPQEAFDNISLVFGLNEDNPFGYTFTIFTFANGNTFYGLRKGHVINSEILYSGKLETLKNSEEYTVFLVVDNSKLSILFNDDILIYEDDFKMNVGGGKSLSITSGDTHEGTILFLDDIRYWDLEDHDIENLSEWTPQENFAALQSFMESNSPTFEDDFTDFNPEWGSGHSEEIGEFPIIRDENSGVLKFPASLGRFSFPYTNIINAEDFILTYEISPQDDFGHCCFEFRATNDSREKYQFCIDVDSINKADFQSSFRRSEEMNFLYTDAQKLNYLSFQKFYKTTILAKDNDIYIYFDDELIHHITGDADTPGSMNRFSIDQKIDETAADAIYFDNLKFWNLEGIDFNLNAEIVSEATPAMNESTLEGPPDFIQTFMETTPPGFEEDFTDDYLSSWGYGWSSARGDFTLASVKRDDELRFFSSLEQFAFPSSDILVGEDFLLIFEILPQEALQSFSFELRVSDYIYNNGPPSKQITDSGYNLGLDFTGDGYTPILLGWGEADYPTYSAEKSFYLSQSPNNYDEVMIYAKDNTIMIFLNGDLVFDATDKASITGRYSRFRVEPNEVQGYILYFDNVKYWNLKWANINP